MTIMAQKIQLKNTWTNSTKQTTKEAIHSGHFMVSDFEAEAQDDEDELAVPVPEEVENKTPILNNQIQTLQSNEYHLQRSWHQLSIETSLSKLFQCMSLAYRQKLTSPKWNRFKGIRLRWKDKIRLNNVIWRCWHMQFINKKNTPICQFASPLDVDTHNKPEAVVLEGKYWKRKLNAVTAEYKKWRMYCHNQILGKPQRYYEMFPELDSQECWAISGGDSMMVDEDYMGLMTDTLFSTITAQPFPFPDPREIARNTNIADFIQPSLVQLQPNLDEIMEIEPLHDFLQCSKLTTVPEESGVLQTVPSYQTKLVDTIGTSYQQQPANTTYTSTDSMWYLPPEYVEAAAAAAASLPPPPYPQAAARCLPPTSANNSNNNNSGNNGNSNTTNATTVNSRHHLVQPPQQQSQLHITNASPPPPPPPPITKNEIFTTPKSKTKGRGRNNAKKGPAYNTNNNSPSNNNNSSNQPMIMPVMSSTSAAVTQLQQQIQQKQPSSSSLQNSTLLAQILTSNSSASYGFIPKEQQPQQPQTSNKLVTLNTVANNCEEVPSFIQQTFSTPIENQLIYKTDKNIHKSTGTTYIVNSDNNANKSVVTTVTSQRTTSPGMTSVLNRTVPSPLNNMGSVCGSGDPLATSDALSLSPLNVGSPTSPIATKEAQPVKEQRRVCHINAEQKRRCNIKNGFDTLHSLIPQLSQNPNAKMSKASMLQKGAEYIRQLRIERNNLKQEIDSLRQEIDTLNTAICNCQALLPATGAPISRQRNSKMRDMFKQYVKSRTHENWKFWLLSLICEPLLESFNNCVSTNSLDELYHTTLQWVDQHCTLVILRQVVLNSFRQLCTTTEVLTDPARLPTEARTSVDRPNKKQS